MPALRTEIVYRNYIPLYNQYLSLVREPPAGYDFYAKKPNPLLKIGFKLYRSFGRNSLMRPLVSAAQKRLFAAKTSSSPTTEMKFLVGMLPDADFRGAYVIDFENVFSLCNFVKPADTNAFRAQLVRTLTSPLCVALLPWSRAALDNLRAYVGDSDFKKLETKSEIFYPSLPAPNAQELRRIQDARATSKDFKILFIGKEPYRKGLPILIKAFQILTAKGIGQIKLTVISDLDAKLSQELASIPGTESHPPRFSYAVLRERFFNTHQAFVLPTLEDTFGLVFVEAQAAGLPIVTTRQWATPEIVRHEVDGLLLENLPLPIDRELLPEKRSEIDFARMANELTDLPTRLAEALERLIRDPELRRHLGERAYENFIGDGNFAIERRNKLFERVRLRAVDCLANPSTSKKE